jgi:hypothetical protein
VISVGKGSIARVGRPAGGATGGCAGPFPGSGRTGEGAISVASSPPSADFSFGGSIVSFGCSFASFSVSASPPSAETPVHEQQESMSQARQAAAVETGFRDFRMRN